MPHDYVHGYTATEAQRLQDQAATLEDLLHADTHFAPGSRVLEVGCGIGAQTLILARRHPHAQITAIERSAASLATARERVQAAGHTNVEFVQDDLFALPARGDFDHVFVCFVLEHLPDPAAALRALRGHLRPGGTITVIEGDHGSTLMHPDSVEARRAIACLVRLQAQAGGDALIGRRLYPLLAASGYADITVAPRVAYADAGRPAWVEGFTRRTFTAMVAGVREPAVAAGWMTAPAFDGAIADLLRTTEADGTFVYSFFKAVARAAAPARSS